MKIKGDKTKYYQLPVIFSVTTLALIVPSLFSNLFSTTILSETEYNIYTFNIILCLLASYIGFNTKSNIILKNSKYNINKILVIVLPFF